ncbi:PAS domain-containing sensor histidine kinase [Aggregicoccus sp. 17bor-14]|uniref:sensor histidine kinase n=1 Tax=Myxococcaceae TaxID=31 RepID=UPI00129CE5E3|nr:MULTISPECIES: ATP-binding protein [Myxococcaceae]MBF5045680.1 PAS domain-containing sensor histidine kinase [Simulacricoccus sp. 17bor-14]MRI91417.1 PAS domain-containing sensor histidine kinase [Aggregicoccus sp. 17bor-14]
MKRRRQPLKHDVHVLLLTLLAGLPGSVTALWILWDGDFSLKVRWTLSALILCVWGGAALAVRERVTRPLQTVSNLLLALRQGDYGVRGRGGRLNDPLGEVFLEANVLGETLREQRLGALEAGELLSKVMEEIDVAVLAFDEGARLRLVNKAGERLMGRGRRDLLGQAAEALALGELLEGAAPRRVSPTFAVSTPGHEGGPYELRRSSFRQHGLPHTLVVLADLGAALREEEREAWKRLIRVLSHEINNSLAPIHSIAAGLQDALTQQPRPSDWDEDAASGLAVIARRSASLSRFMSSYARLARLPPPSLGTVAVSEWVRRVASLEKRLAVEVRAGPELTLRADGDQLEQLLINLVRNAADAALETQGRVWLSWSVVAPGALEVWVEDEGPGLPDTANLFVPFFTTKPNGSGIGLALSRQIAEAHGGSVRLENRAGEKGCRARLRLPFEVRAPAPAQNATA